MNVFDLNVFDPNVCPLDRYNLNILHYIERCTYDVLLLIRTDLRNVPLQFFHEAVCLEGSNFSGKKLHTVLFWKNLAQSRTEVNRKK